jgi:DNA-binding NarL/FixJ family response regulator
VQSKQPLRILLVDDHPIVRFGVRQMVATLPDLSIGTEADTAEAALQAVKRAKADLAIVDLSLGPMSGLELIRQLRELDPKLPVLVLSMHDEALFAERAFRAGARGYIMKQEAIDGLIHAIREVLAGRMYASERVSQEMLERVGRSAAPTPGGLLGGLTDRELEVFEMIGRGGVVGGWRPEPILCKPGRYRTPPRGSGIPRSPPLSLASRAYGVALIEPSG